MAGMNTYVTPRLVQFSHDVLADHAHHHETTTYKDHYLALQPVFNLPVIRDWGHPGQAWYDRLGLAQVGTLCGQRGEPSLPCLVRHQDGSVGDGYVTGHLNTHGVSLLRVGHPYRCPCCRFRINRAARAETQLAWAYF
jgi:hypothetical protein